MRSFVVGTIASFALTLADADSDSNADSYARSSARVHAP